jgi:hypothetical protein
MSTKSSRALILTTEPPCQALQLIAATPYAKAKVINVTNRNPAELVAAVEGISPSLVVVHRCGEEIISAIGHFELEVINTERLSDIRPPARQPRKKHVA